MNAAELRPAVRALYGRLPETRRLRPGELRHALFGLGHKDDPAVEVARGGRPQWKAA